MPDLSPDAVRLAAIRTRLLQAPPDASLMSEVLGRPVSSLREGCEALLPGARIAGAPPAGPEGLPPLTVSSKGYKPITLTWPVDWAMDPYGDRPWRVWFQSLSWLDSARSQDDAAFHTAAALVQDWVARVQRASAPFEMTWDSHAIAARLDRTWRFLQHGLAREEGIDGPLLEACLDLILTHLYVLTSDEHYDSRHNHGFMQDKSLLVHALRLPALADAPALIALAEDRVRRQQIEASVTPDGIHIENSPGYHLIYTRLIEVLIREAYAEAGRQPPGWMVETRNRMLENAFHMLDKGTVLIAFGDTMRDDVAPDLRTILRSSQKTVPLPDHLRANIVYINSGGRDGVAPEAVDRVFRSGGYACLRSGWTHPDAPPPVLLHIKASRLTQIHSHEDESSFTLGAFGHDLIVDPGRYSNDRSHPMSKQGATAAAHNMFCVAGAKARRESRSARIHDSGTVGEDVVWLLSGHDFYAKAGLRSYRRLFVFWKPFGVAVIDAVEAERPLDCHAHLHLHPDLSARIEGQLARATLATGEGVEIQGLGPGLTLQQSGTDGLPPSFYFPKEYEAVPSSSLRFHWKAEPGTQLLPVLLRLVPAEGAPAMRLEVSQTGSEVSLQLVRGTETRRLSLPREALFPRAAVREDPDPPPAPDEPAPPPARSGLLATLANRLRRLTGGSG